MPLPSRPLLVCPVCRGPLEALPAGRTLGCGSGHRFDAARQGYYNLLTGGGTKFQADTAEMVQARVDFLAAGHYAPMAGELARIVADAVPEARTLVDAGAGTGYYLDRVRQQLPSAYPLALDISKFALRRSARALPQGLSLVWDVWRPLPVADAAADVVLNVFAPRNPEEFRRILAAGGVLAVVTPGPGHLAEIRGLAGLLEIGGEKEQRVAQALAGGFTLDHAHHVETPLALNAADVRNLALMGPAAHHLDRGRLEAELHRLQGPVAATASFRLQLFRAV